MKTIEERLAKLEQANRRWKACVMMACVIGIAAFFTGANEATKYLGETVSCKTIIAEEVILQKKGKILISMTGGKQEHEGGRLSFYPLVDPTEKGGLPPICLSVMDDDGIIGVFGPDGAGARLDGGKIPGISIRSSPEKKPFSFATFGLRNGPEITSRLTK